MGSPGVTDKCLTDLLIEQAKTRPDDIAVRHGSDTLTYGELVADSLDLARHLRHLGVSTDSRVGVLVDPSLDLMVGTWGVLFAGGAYLPLSPDYPDERLRYMLEDARVTVAFCQESLRSRLEEIAPPHVVITTSKDVKEYLKSASGDIPGALVQNPDPHSLAYVIYTSGSTGKPKGVMIEHRSIVHQMNWLGQQYGLDSTRVVLQKTPMSFDAAQWEILAPACGSRVVVGASGIHRDPKLLIDTVVREGVTTLQCVPTLLQALVDTDELDRCTSLTHIFSGGEVLSRGLARRCTDLLPGCTVVNVYGPTECTINTSAHTFDPTAPDDGTHSVPIGTPVDGLRCHVLDAGHRPLGPGETGELYVSGIQLARGYLHRPGLTAERFVESPSGAPAPHDRLYRTGDLASWDPDGTLRFAGRVDNQVKLRGFRIELDEIRLAIEAHDWVRNAAVLVRDDPRTGFQNLVAFVQLSAREAALMDQGNHDGHHLSKESKLQVKAQLSSNGVRDAEDLAGRTVVPLPGATATGPQRRRAFARKTYRFYDGGSVASADVLAALARRAEGAAPRSPAEITLDELGGLLRNFGQFRSQERLLAKYAYASPGSLYATQLYLEVAGIGGLAPGCYYYHPLRHELYLIRGAEAGAEATRSAAPGIRLHFVGRRRAIEPVYRNNILEVLEIEAGHMVGLFDELLPAYGLAVGDAPYEPGGHERLECAPEDHYLGSFALTPWSQEPGPRERDAADVYVQFHPGSGSDLPPGQYLYRDGLLERVADELVLKRHVIAINQAVYERAGFGITIVSRAAEERRGYLDLGRRLQHLMMNTGNLGFMSAGYSSRTGKDLPAARRMAGILRDAGRPAGPSYFFVGGRVTDEQLAHEGMNEDSVHMKGPAELIKEDLVALLPEFMLPNRILVMDSLPHTPNGKIDHRALEAHADTTAASDDDRPVVPPRTTTETRICDLWKAALKRDVVSVRDDFFACGGNSLIAVALVNRINRAFSCSLPLQVIFEAPTVERLAERVDAPGSATSSRLIPLSTADSAPPVFCWPGLGGYTMNLRLLASRTAADRPFYGVQSYGINRGETPFPSIEEMARTDIEVLRRVQPEGPYTLWGYSFGARVAFETARQLERAGAEVERLFLLSPGSPRVPGAKAPARAAADFTDPTFVTILFSVFGARTSGPLLDACLEATRDEETFRDFVISGFPELDAELIRRLIAVVCLTYSFTYDVTDPDRRPVRAPVTVFTARGDAPSFIERAPALTSSPPELVRLDADHYGVLRDPGVDELAKAIHRETTRQTRNRTCLT
ncbi:amino acid adenylation domain-containing protein [Streptomyces sp. AM 2-1-1]|uniref:non-ribosomal peptide synthetase family protein n=1 Tax=Streptomyces sp. AM 2-1-1 TaxID=3028709 RepID=UPI0023BA2D4D|nr:amino acid adenylation domain-containing protein [Streptomyces sp. AM 2-1-1]WEH39042.1 amino acid adenylation domain-containing protein [Streptomyces sp. AM 2-1-1]